MSSKPANLWRHHHDFLKLWSARTTSVFGSQIASLAYQLTAILVLQATTFQVGLLQAIKPNRLQGRMNASFCFANVGMMFGALVAGYLGELIGLRETLAVGAVKMFLPFLRLLFSPLRNLLEHPGEKIN